MGRTDYKGFEIYSPTPSGLAGQALNANFVKCADHIADVANPHGVTTAQIGAATDTHDHDTDYLLRAASDFNTFTEKPSLDSGDRVLIEDSAAGGAKKYLQAGNLPGAAGGEDNTASSAGSGTSLYYQKSGIDLQFNAIKSENDRLTVALDSGTHDVELTVNEGNIVHQNLSGAGSNTHAQIDTHIASTANPHGTDVGNLGSGTLAELNTAITDATLDDTTGARTPTAHATSHQSGGGDAVKLDDLATPDDNTDLNATTSYHGLLPKLGGGTTNFLRADGSWTEPPGTGEQNTASSAGSGTTLYYTKSGVDLQFNAIKSENNRLSVALDAVTHDVELTVNEGNIVHDNIFGSGTNTHAQIDTHLASTSNPHSTDVGNLGSGTLSELNTAITDATLDDSSDPRTPTAHATTHQSGGSDAIKLDDLATPDDNTDLDATITYHGLLPKLDNDNTHYLDGTGSWTLPPKTVYLRIYGITGELFVDDGEGYFTIGSDINGMDLISAHACVYTPSTLGQVTLQIHNDTDGFDMLTTPITIDANEYSSYTAATPPVVNTSYDDVATGDRIRIDVDSVGTGTRGLDIILVFRSP